MVVLLCFVQPINAVVAPHSKKYCFGCVQAVSILVFEPGKHFTILFLFIGFAPKDLLHF